MELKSFTIPNTPKEQSAPITVADTIVIINWPTDESLTSFDLFEVGVHTVFFQVYLPTHQLMV